MTKQNNNDASCIAQLKYPGGVSFSVCFSYMSQTFLNSHFVAVGTDATRKIQQDSPVFFAPALGGVVFNFESTKAREVVSCAGHYEIKPLTSATAASVIAKLFGPYLRWGKNVAQIDKPKPFHKTKSANVCSINPWDNACEVMQRLLEKDNPELAKAVKAGKSNRDRTRAFVADVVRRLGFGPSGFSADDPEYNRLVSEAWQHFDNRKKRKSRADIVDWHLAHPNNWIRYYDIEDSAQISQLVAEETGTDALSGPTIEKHMERLKLIRNCKQGPRKK